MRKQFTSLREKLTAGNTILLPNMPKTDETWIPKNYRPIACLPTTFKILISIITDRLYIHLEDKAITAKEQRGGKKEFYGCKDQLMILLPKRDETWVPKTYLQTNSMPIFKILTPIITVIGYTNIQKNRL